ncbi:MAG TPA: hypothetical protein VG820_08240 [Fimbriimonadaceae bacterium]|nr:hypothetical protein [Fimbriimonadaceae bacterium]
MKPLGVVGALIGGLIGALLWGGITAATKLEIGYMATGVGFLVGFGSAIVGGRGFANGVMCAIVALLAMFGGKVATTRFLAPSMIREELLKEPGADKATDAKIDQATQDAIAHLSLADYIEGAKESLDPIDILFGVIGVVAAFRIGVSGTYRSKPASPGYSTTAPGGPTAFTPPPSEYSPAPPPPSTPGSEPAPPPTPPGQPQS